MIVCYRSLDGFWLVPLILSFSWAREIKTTHTHTHTATVRHTNQHREISEQIEVQSKRVMPHACKQPSGEIEKFNYYHRDLIFGRITNDDFFQLSILQMGVIDFKCSDKLLTMKCLNSKQFSYSFGRFIFFSIGEKSIDKTPRNTENDVPWERKWVQSSRQRQVFRPNEQ